jgi:hypothetical protein
MTVETLSGEAVAHRLQRLAQLYQNGQASRLMDRTLDKLLSYEAEQSRAQLADLKADLAGYERRYQLSSAEFYRRYQAGQTDDRMDYVEWASLVQMTNRLEDRLRLLTMGDEP